MKYVDFCVCGGQKATPGTFIYHSLIFLRQGLSENLKLTDSATLSPSDALVHMFLNAKMIDAPGSLGGC